MATIDKLNYLNETKNLIKNKLNDFGAGITDNDTFRSYVDKMGKLLDGNLFDKDNPNIINGYINASGVITNSGTTGDKILYIPCKPNTTYTIKKMISMRFRIGCSNTVPTYNVALNPFSGNQQTNTYYTITSASDSKYLAFWGIDKDEAAIEQEILDSIRIVKVS